MLSNSPLAAIGPSFQSKKMIGTNSLIDIPSKVTYIPSSALIAALGVSTRKEAQVHVKFLVRASEEQDAIFPSPSKGNLNTDE